MDGILSLEDFKNLQQRFMGGGGGGKKKKKSGIMGGLKGMANVGFKFGDEGKQAGTLAELIEKQAASQKRQAEAKNPSMSMSPFDMLQDQLFGAVNSIGGTPTPVEQLRQLATQQVNAQFNPQIDALMAEMGRTSNKATGDQKTARQMYGALSKDFLAQLPELTQQFAAEDQATNQRYDQAQAQMDAEYDKQAAEQAAVLKRLGVQAASQDSSQQAMDDQAYFQNQAELDQQNAASALNEQQNAQLDYQRNLGSNAKMAGENTAQDIGAQLRDYLGQANTQLTGLQGQRGSAIEALLSQMQMQDQQRLETQKQQEFDNMLKLYNFQLQATKAGQSAASEANQPGAFGAGPGTSGLTTGLAGANNYLAGQYPDQPILASNLMEQLNDVLSNKEVTQGKFVLEPGDPAMGKSPKYSDVGQEYMMDLLRSEFEKEGGRYNTGDINATMNALLAYLGKLR